MSSIVRTAMSGTSREPITEERAAALLREAQATDKWPPEFKAEAKWCDSVFVYLNQLVADLTAIEGAVTASPDGSSEEYKTALARILASPEVLRETVGNAPTARTQVIAEAQDQLTHCLAMRWQKQDQYLRTNDPQAQIEAELAREEYDRLVALDMLLLRQVNVHMAEQRAQLGIARSTKTTGQPISERKPIPERVRHEVWRRDQGRCVDCGSRERLEYDHIIAVANGGSNTARNIELRCEPCNRKKGAKI